MREQEKQQQNRVANITNNNSLYYRGKMYDLTLCIGPDYNVPRFLSLGVGRNVDLDGIF